MKSVDNKKYLIVATLGNFILCLISVAIRAKIILHIAMRSIGGVQRSDRMLRTIFSLQLPLIIILLNVFIFALINRKFKVEQKLLSISVGICAIMYIATIPFVGW